MILTYREPVEELLDSEHARIFINFRQEEGIMAMEHWHQCAELLYLFGGSVCQTINTCQMELHSGDTLLIASGDIHATKAITDTCYVGVSQFYSPFPHGTLYLPAQDAPNELSRIFSMLHEESTLRQPGYESISRGLLLQALGWMQRRAQPLSDSIPPTTEALRIAGYIQEHVLDGITLPAAAEFCGYSPSHFSRYFQKIMGCSFRSYLEEVKMRTAKKLLLEGISVSEASAMLHYDGVSSFSRDFKRKFGLAPGAYLERQQMHNKQQKM